MLRLERTTPAADQLEHAQDYCRALNPMAEAVMALRGVEAAQRPCGPPAMAHPGRVAGSREWGVGKTPNLLVYARARRCAGSVARLARGAGRNAARRVIPERRGAA